MVIVSLEARVKNLYDQKCITYARNTAQPENERRDPRSETGCKTECVLENTQGGFEGNLNLERKGGTYCEAFSFNPGFAGKSCILHIHQHVFTDLNAVGNNVWADPAPEAASEGQAAGWKCFQVTIVDKDANGRNGEYVKTDSIVQPEAPARPRADSTFFPMSALPAGYMAKRHRVAPLSQANCFEPYTWLEVEAGNVGGGGGGGKGRRLDDESDQSSIRQRVDWTGQWWKSQVSTGKPSFIPVSQDDFNLLRRCLRPVGATGWAAHVVTTDRVCVDTVEAGWCIQHAWDLSCIWKALIPVLIAFLVGRYCCRPTTKASSNKYFQISVHDSPVGQSTILDNGHNMTFTAN